MLLQQQQGGTQGLFALQLQNPFSLRVGQIFTGFGVGCGIGIGVGRPIPNLNFVPGLSDVASAGASSLGSVRHHLQNLGNKFGIKNVQAGVGCGVGLGHGFGIGVTLKPGVVQQLKHLVEQGLSAIKERMQSVAGSSNVEGEGDDNTSGKRTLDEGKILPGTSFSKSSTSEKLLGDFLPNSLTAATKSQGQETMHGEVDRLQTENRILLTLLAHQEQIDVLKKENAALKQALAEERDCLKSSSDDVEHSMELKLHKRTECFECRRRGWQRRRSN